jgi:hypothetical protein
MQPGSSRGWGQSRLWTLRTGCGSFVTPPLQGLSPTMSTERDRSYRSVPGSFSAEQRARRRAGGAASTPGTWRGTGAAPAPGRSRASPSSPARPGGPPSRHARPAPLIRRRRLPRRRTGHSVPKPSRLSLGGRADGANARSRDPTIGTEWTRLTDLSPVPFPGRRRLLPAPSQPLAGLRARQLRPDRPRARPPEPPARQPAPSP